MAYWITHTIVAEKVSERIPFLDKKGFCIGNIAPDCNIENEDWTAFVPPREVTHFMCGSKKSMEGCEKFFDTYIKDKTFASDEQYSFLLGYYSHLVTDVKWLEYMHDTCRINDCYERIKKIPELYEKIRDLSVEYYSIKNTLGKRCFLDDVVDIEQRYIIENPDNSYNGILRKTTEFPDYIDFLPEGAILRKIGIMAYEPPTEIAEREHIFYTAEEYKRFITDMTELMCKLITDKCS